MVVNYGVNIVTSPSPPSPLPPPETHHDDQGRPFEFVHIPHEGATDLVIHFSAFFGAWGNARPYRDQFQGYFHRMKMLGRDERHNWLFLCDSYGPFDNGTYYTGRAGDFFVERSMVSIIERIMQRQGVGPERAITIGSSMGATAAIKFALLLDLRGAVGIVPHIDLDLCAAYQNRMKEVSWIVPDGDATAEHNRPFTRQISHLASTRPPDRPLPRLFVQSCIDDVGVHHEQVIPLLERWRDHGGEATLDARPTGGHTSDWATAPLLFDVVDHLLDGTDIDPLRYQTEAPFVGSPTVPPLTHRIRRRLSLTRKAIFPRRYG